MQTGRGLKGGEGDEGRGVAGDEGMGVAGIVSPFTFALSAREHLLASKSMRLDMLHSMRKRRQRTCQWRRG